MIRKALYGLLDNPWLYHVSQLVFAPGADKRLRCAIEELTQKYDTSGKIIDVGCGPSSWLWAIGASPVGLDISYEYSSAYKSKGSSAVTGSAFSLPFLDNSFEGVWCVGVLHHLTDDNAKATIFEMLRICRSGGYIIIMDAVLPKNALSKPVATVVRNLDRGKFMRTQGELECLLPQRKVWSTSRFSYTLTGLEMLLCTYNKI